MNCASVTDAV